MSSALEISFRVPPRTGTDAGTTPHPGVVALGRRHFRVYADQDGFALPEVLVEREPGNFGYLTVHLPPRVEVRAEPGEPIPAQLAHALETVWVPQEYTIVSVDGLRVLSSNGRLPVSLVYGDPRTATPGAPFPGRHLRVDVHWSVDYTGPAGNYTAPGSVTVEFAPPGEQPPTAAETASGFASGFEPEDDGEFLALRTPQPAGDHFQQFVVVDLGSTASTATLWDLGNITHRLVDPDQTAALAELMRELLEPPPGAPTEWLKVVESIMSGRLVLGRRGGQRITGREALARLNDADVVDALLVKVEQSLHQDSRPALRDWLASRLYDGYARVMSTPALDRHKLRPVDYADITGKRTHAPASALVEQLKPAEDGPGVDPLPQDRRFELCGENADGAITGIKRALLEHPPRPVGGTDMSAVHLAQHMYLRLVERAEELTRREGDRSEPRLRTAVITYPTSILPEIKLRLETLVRTGLGIPQVVMDYDEGLAASLFFVMRELSDNQNLGLEALRSRSRHVSDDPPTWHRILLAIDIGGGTTDIALLRLALVDQTPELAAEEEFVSGRDYRLEPQLLGSTGHGQLGGDLLTLQVFYWIKACFVDQLRSGAGSPGTTSGTGADGESVTRALSTRIADQAAEMLNVIVAPDVHRTLDEYLPTRWDNVRDEAERDRRRRRFTLLWQQAELQKRALGKGADGNGGEGSAAAGTIRTDHVQAILDACSHGLGQAKEVRLDPADFRKLLQPVLSRAAEMGGDLVRTVFTRIHEENTKRLAKGLDPHPVPALDQVVLSGRSSALEQVRENVIDVLTKVDADSQVRLGWNPTALAVEKGFIAKQATSLGAAWAHSTHALAGVLGGQRTRLRATDAVIRLSDLDIRTQGLFSALPSDFGPVTGEARVLPVLRAGTPFIELDARGTRGVRTDWQPLSDLVLLYRAVSSKDSIQWGSFNLFLAADAESMKEPLSEVWRRMDGSGVNYRLEMDHRLFSYILLCNGTPHLLVTGQHLELNDALPGLAFNASLGQWSLPGSLCVSLGAPDAGAPDLVEVFPAPQASGGSAGAGTGAGTGTGAGETYLGELFHDTTDSEEPPVPGRVAVLDALPVRGNYHFYLLRDGSGQPEYLGRLPAPGQGEHSATLDAHGRLRVHRGTVPYLPAETLRQVEQRPGRVLHRPMNRGVSNFNKHWDPTNGSH
ncbi:hypothetical protein ACWDZ6_17250 [Streptomyces sp. NPDC002926]